MTNITTADSSPMPFGFKLPQFWICNILGWLVFSLAEGLRNSVDGSPFAGNFFNYLPTALVGVVSGFTVHLLYRKYAWFKQHPVNLIPVASGLAIVFGVLNSALNDFEQFLAIPEICARDYLRPPFACGYLSDLFLQSLGAMLLWCLFYFLIQAERNQHHNLNRNWPAVLRAFLCLSFLSYLGIYFSVIAWVEWGETHYLYSRAYFISALSLFTPFVSSAYVLFVRRDSFCWNSRTMALMPLLLVMAFCCVTFNMGVSGILSRLDNLPENWTWRYVLFGEFYGNFGHPNILAGVIDGGFVNSLAATLFYLSYRYAPIKSAEQAVVVNAVNTKKVFATWGYSVLFWLFFGLLIYTADIMDWAYFGKSVPITNTLAFTGAGVVIGAVLRLQMLLFAAHYTSMVTLALKIVAVSVFAGVLLSSTIWLCSYAYIFVVLKGDASAHFSSFIAADNFIVANLLATCVLSGLWSFICYMMESMRQHREATIKQLQLEKNMKEMQLSALAGKLDPHFIFNALNNIRALVNEDGEKARSAIAVLSDILRSPMTSNVQDKIPIKDELNLVRNYVSLAKIQLEDRLLYQEDVDEHVSTALIPAMTLQILVENALKHGIGQLSDGGTLMIKIHKQEQKLICEVSNHGSLKRSANTQGFGFGTNAVRDRLALLYAGSASFNLQELNDTVVAKLELPFETNL